MKSVLKNLFIAILIVALLITGAYFLLQKVTMHGEEIPVPDLSNLTVAEASDFAAQKEMDDIIATIDAIG